MKKMYIQILVSFLLCGPMLFSCNNKSVRTDKSKSISEYAPLYSEEIVMLDYVFIDKHKVLHSTRFCEVLANPETYNGRYYDGKEILNLEVSTVCSQCVNFETYKELRALGIVK